MLELQAPQDYTLFDDLVVFLAGSIEMDTAENWQQRLVKAFEDEDVVFLNPRRADWDPTITQESTDPQFFEQVNWELNSIEFCDVLVFYFDPNTKSPVTLLELGLVANSRKNVIVCCPNGFYRKGNVEVVCSRYGIQVVNTVQELYVKLKSNLDELHKQKP